MYIMIMTVTSRFREQIRIQQSGLPSHLRSDPHKQHPLAQYWSILMYIMILTVTCRFRDRYAYKRVGDQATSLTRRLEEESQATIAPRGFQSHTRTSQATIAPRRYQSHTETRRGGLMTTRTQQSRESQATRAPKQRRRPDTDESHATMRTSTIHHTQDEHQIKTKVGTGRKSANDENTDKTSNRQS